MNRNDSSRFSLTEAISIRIAAYLSELCVEDEGLFGNVDHWTQRRIIDENMAKLALVLESNDPAETCYRDLIREIDAESETGIYLVRSDATSRHLKRLLDEPGISGELHREMETIAPVVFPEETSRSIDDLELVWVTIQATHDRALADATVSEIILSFLNDDADRLRDMSNAMRALQYSFHEDVVRRRCDLPLLLDERENRELLIMISDLAIRSGSYCDRVADICKEAETLEGRTLPDMVSVRFSRKRSFRSPETG
jgi:hypothetical protein